MEIAAGKFKSQCLDLMDLVAESDVEVIITKRGKPVARLVRPEVKKKKVFFGCLKGGDLRRYHRAPADRLLVATARVFKLTLVTRDARILAYGAEGQVQTHKV